MTEGLFRITIALCFGGRTSLLVLPLGPKGAELGCLSGLFVLSGIDVFGATSGDQESVSVVQLLQDWGAAPSGGVAVLQDWGVRGDTRGHVCLHVR